jgi:photosystem II stability/assembly factor-like uncharacterized protein
VNKIYFALIAIMGVVGAQFFLGANSYKNLPRFMGDADAIGSEEDANARMNYEIARLRDPETGKIPANIREQELAFAATLPHMDINAMQHYAKSSAATWQARGPWNVGGRTRAIALDINNENIIVAGSCSGGMWRSTDQGQTWTRTSDPNKYESVSCLAQDTRTGHTGTWYYGSGEAYGASASASGAYYLGNGIYKSTDNGQTWSVLPSTTTNNFTGFDSWADISWNVAVNKADMVNDVVYVAAYGGIYKSLDGGASWTLAKGTFGGSDSYFTDVAVTSAGVIYATLSSDGSQKGIYRSTDGITFTDITPASFPATYNRLKIGICPDDERQVYIVGNTPGAGYPDTNYLGDIEWNSMWKYNYISGDGSGAGGNWRNLSNNLPSTGGLFDKFQTQGSYDIVVKVKPGDSNTVFLGGTNVYRSTSGFKDNTHTTFVGGYKQGATLPVVDLYLNHHPDQHELIFLPSNPNKMISSNDGGIFMTNDNTSGTVVWNPLNNGYLTTMFYTCAMDHATTTDIVIGGAQDNGSWYTNSANLTTPWVTPRGGDGSYCAIADNEAAYYFSIQNGKMMRAKLNASGAVDSFARIDPRGGKGYLFINPFVLDPNNNNIMYLAGGKYLWRNDNLSGIPYASNWDSITTNWIQFPDSVPTGGATITALAISKTPANRLYYGTSSKRVYRIDNANSGTPTATDITGTSLSALFPTGYVSSIAVDPNNADHVMVAFSNYSVYSIFYSEDGGGSWSKIAGNLEQSPTGSGGGPSVRWVSIIPVANGTVYMAGTSTGLYATTQLFGNGTYWTQQAHNEIGYDIVDMIDYRATDGLVVVATHSHGIYSTHITDVNDIVGVKEVTALAPVLNFTNYPNPFRDQTTLSFSLNSKTPVTIAIYDEMGRYVKTVTQQAMDAGEKKVSVSASGMSNGIYYCKLTAGEYTETKRIVVAR